MRLKKLELYGFKSFAQRTEIVFNEGITGIVGPNGSGKSNIGDAVRWVLGEQSARTLRGTNMQDIIFNGTQRRKPLNYCEVSLVFENEDRALPMDCAEVAVTRRVYRSGESEYFLNRASCRLRDVVDLFRDTGIGKEGYSIIGQGRIDDILSRKGEDRRLVFEEAAGIVKFRARKEEADRKLARTQDNMSRVTDIMEEMEKRLEPLGEQAANARVYLEKHARLKELDLNLFLIRSDRMDAKLRELDSDLQSMASIMSRTEETLQEKSRLRDERQEEIAGLDARITEAHAAQMAGMEAVHGAQDAVRTVEERRKNRAENRERIAEELREAGERIEELERLFTETEGSGEAGDAALKEREEALRTARQEEEKAREAEAEKESSLEAGKAEMLEMINRRSAILSDQTRLKTMLQTMESRQGEIEESCRAMTGAEKELETVLADARQRLKKEEEEQERLEAALSQVREALEGADREVVLARAGYDEKLKEMRDMESRWKLLDEMSREMEGYSGAVRTVMRHAREKGIRGVRGPLNQLISVPREYETAIDMVLGMTQQNVVTEDEETAKGLIDYLRQNRLGRATFLPMTSVRSKTLDAREREALKLPGCLGVASDLVSCDGEYRGILENLLGRTVIAKDLTSGIAIMRRGGHSFRLVTLQGDVMHSGGSMTGGSVSSRTVNLFSRERELKELKDKLGSGQKELEKLLAAMKEGQARKDRLKTDSAAALEQLHQQEIAVARETERTQNAEEELKSHAMRRRETEAAREQLMESILQIQDQLSRVTGTTEQSDADRESMEKKTAALQEELTAARAETEKRAEETLRLTLAVNDLRHELETMERDRARYEQECLRMKNDQERRRRSLQELEDAEAEDLTREGALKGKLEAVREEQKVREEAAGQLEKERTGRQQALSELLREIEELHQTAGRDGDRMHRLELNRSRTEGDLKALREKIWNTYELTYAGAEEFRRKEPFNTTEADREAARLSAEIRALGPVNVHAVEEYSETKARYDEYQAQRGDLEKAEKDLKELIEDLLEQMKETFVRQFNLLQGYFSETFVRLFGGGHAELILADPSDPLNCAIEINAQPPGKKLQLLSLLSGGERTLTAIAILFATLKLKPSPFCILDEIEAALDDANIGYFADYLQEYSKSTQFVVVTHRKGTMERANALYGVAMEEQGVSKMVSVSLKDYQE